MPQRELGWYIMDPSNQHWWVVYILAFLGVAILGHVLYRRYLLWRTGRPEYRLDNLLYRVKSFVMISIMDGLFHRRFFRMGTETDTEKSPKVELLPGVMHISILCGCVLLLIGTAADFISHYWLEFLSGNTYLAFNFINDFGGVLILLGLILVFVRRYIQRPERLDNKAEDVIVLIVVFLAVISGFILEGFRIAATQSYEPGLALPEWEQWGFLGFAFSLSFSGMASSTQLAWYQGMWWFHVIFIMAVLVYVSLSFSKLLHMIVSPLNVFFRSLRPKGALIPLRLDDVETIGIERIQDFTWKQILDLDACVRCGRCQDNCPAYLSGKTLSPKKIIQNLKSCLDGDDRKRLNKSNNRSLALIGDVVAEDDLWSCLTCGACQEACPVFVEHIDRIVKMRMNQVLMKSSLPHEAMAVFKNLENQGNVWGKAWASRSEWCEGMNIPLLNGAVKADVLLWVGCLGSYEDRSSQVMHALVRVLQRAGVNFGILGKWERCCGDPARRLGEEYLFQKLARENINTINRCNIRTVVTVCPHCFNTIKNEYTQLGGDFRVMHHTEFILNLLNEGNIELSNQIGQSITYHDPCYLRRHNDIHKEPRSVLGSICRQGLLEMNLSGNNGFCCGGGGGRMWLAERTGYKVNVMRVEQALATNSEIITTSCPYCIVMLEDGVGYKNQTAAVKVMDVVELVDRATT